MRRAILLLSIIPLALAACAGAPKPKDGPSEAARAEVSQLRRKPPATRQAGAIALREPALPAASSRVAAALAESDALAAEQAARDKAAVDKAAADKAAAEKAAADKAARDAAAAKAAADKAAADKAAADKAVRDAAADKAAAAEKKAAAEKAAADKKAADKAVAKKKTEPASASPGTPAIKSAPASQAIVVDPAAERQPDISRNVSATEGSRFELPFEGTGWTYLGERAGKDGILYNSRRFEGASVVFALNAAKAGDYVLRFQRQDALRGLTYEELVGVTVAPREGTASAASSTAPAAQAGSTAKAPASTPAQASTPAAQPQAAAPTKATPTAAAATPSPASVVASAAPSTATAPASSQADPAAAKAAPIPDTPEGMLLYAREELAAGRPQGAIEALDRLLARYPAGMDEAFYLYGLALEQSGPLKDIKRAYSYYRMVRDDYPESGFWEKANARIGYIERHYFEIR